MVSMSKSLAQTNKSSARRPEQIDDQHEAALGGLDQGEFTKARTSAEGIAGESEEVGGEVGGFLTNDFTKDRRSTTSV